MVGTTTTSSTVIFPLQEAFSADARSVNQLLGRWIEAKTTDGTGMALALLLFLRPHDLGLEELFAKRERSH